MAAQDVIKVRQHRKEDLVFVHGEKCAICGYDKCIAALEFHHINPDSKNRPISGGNTHSWESDVEESKKCILVCSNCHREIHSFHIENLQSSFIEARFIEKNNEKQAEKNHCKICGKEITYGAICCRECYDIGRQQVHRPSKEDLKAEIRDNSFLALSQKYGVSDNSIRKWCKKYGLPVGKRLINSYSDEEWDRLYC